MAAGASGAFSRFLRFVDSRAAAQRDLETTGRDGSGTLGPLLLLGRDQDLLERLGKVAVETSDASLTEVLSWTKAGWWSSTSAVVVFAVGNEADTSPQAAAERVNGVVAAIQGEATASVVYVRHSGEPREAWAVATSSHEFEALDGSPDLVDVDFRRLVRVLRCKPDPCMGAGTYFVSLTFPDIGSAVSSGEEWTPPEWAVDRKGPLHSGLEVRADLLKNQDDAFVLAQLALVRRHSEGLPIIYTVRSREQGGAFPDVEADAWKLMMVGLRFGVEYVDVEACWTREGRNAFYSLVKKTHRGTRIIGSYHAVQRPVTEISDSDLCAIFHECALAPPGAPVDIVKVVGKAESAQCSIRINQAAITVQRAMPKSVVMLGPTPVAHPALPGKAAPGQLSAVEIEQVRITLGLPSNPFALSTPDGQVPQRRFSATMFTRTADGQAMDED